jgi:two-component system chemotaxis response regulator CheB
LVPPAARPAERDRTARRQGHAYSEEIARLALDESLRRALGSGLRALEERAALANRMRDQANGRGYRRSAEDWARNAQEYEQEADMIRQSIRRIDELAAMLT